MGALLVLVFFLLLLSVPLALILVFVVMPWLAKRQAEARYKNRGG